MEKATQFNPIFICIEVEKEEIEEKYDTKLKRCIFFCNLLVEDVQHFITLLTAINLPELHQHLKASIYKYSFFFMYVHPLRT
jgi:hypothetical protein